MATGSTRVILTALAANAGIAVAKFAAAGITGSSAMLTEGVHSLVDCTNQGLLLYGGRRARKAADALHPLGYGRELYFWSFVVAILVFALGAGVSIYEGILHILHPEPTVAPLIAFVVLGVSFALVSGATEGAAGGSQNPPICKANRLVKSTSNAPPITPNARPRCH